MAEQLMKLLKLLMKQKRPGGLKKNFRTLEKMNILLSDKLTAVTDWIR